MEVHMSIFEKFDVSLVRAKDRLGFRLEKPYPEREGVVVYFGSGDLKKFVARISKLLEEDANANRSEPAV